MMSEKKREEVRKMVETRRKNGSYVCTPEKRLLLSSISKGRKLSEETKQKMLGRIPWNKGRKEVYSEETKQKMREAKLGKSSHKKGKTLVEMYGEGRAREIIEKHRLKMIGKTYEIRYGKEKAEEISRKRSQILKGINKGPNNWMWGRFRELSTRWQGGKSFEPYTLDFNSRFKEAIRARDNRCCIVCNSMEESLGEKLSIHHVDYDKLNTFPQNCVSLCRSCHADTQINRPQWKTFFQSVLTERYGYKYSLDQKIIVDFANESLISPV